MNSTLIDSDFDKPLYTIGVVADLLNISVHSLRLYEREHLILSFKKDSNHRLYSARDIERLKCIRTALTEKKFSIPAIKTMFAMIPCWELKPCSEQDRESCPAYIGHDSPCWSFKHKGNVCEGQVCRECHVYRNYSNCDDIKNGIKQSTR